MLLMVLGLPALDLLLIWRIVYGVSGPGLLPFLLAIPVSCIIAALCYFLFIKPQGNTVMEINIGAFILLVMLLIVGPTFWRAKEKALANAHKRALHRRIDLALKKVPLVVQNARRNETRSKSHP
ncbi:hypothetical protein IAD21_01007 [Abditibacteriota bacterium]|nr:hypothetical protein IAD21_01007 [Abditibacteriota bacterium]